MPPQPFQAHALVPIQGSSVPLWILPSGTARERKHLAPFIEELLGPDLLVAAISSCRGVSADRLPVILWSGCDVEPSTAPFFTGPLDKALEYGGDSDQVIQIFRPEHLASSWREYPSSLPTEERARIAQDYPTLIPSIDGTRLWFTRFPPEDPRAATPYETEYGRWIPGDASLALAALLILAADPTARIADLLQNPETDHATIGPKLDVAAQPT
jgi:hypothetical protein